MCVLVVVLSGPSGVVHGEKRAGGEARVSWRPSGQPVPSERSSRFCLVAVLCQPVDGAYSAAASSQGAQGPCCLQAKYKLWILLTCEVSLFFPPSFIMATFSQMVETKKLMQLRRFAKGTGGLVFLTALSGTSSASVSLGLHKAEFITWKLRTLNS